MTRRGSTARRPVPAAAAVVVGLLVALVLAGCTGLPEAGPVVDAADAAGTDPDRPFDLDAVPPADDASGVEVVRGFLDAMTASPVRLDVAREYLSDASAARWNPEAATITYGERLPERVVGGAVTVRLRAAQRLDGNGAWRGRLAPGQQTLRFTLTTRDGQYRIVDPPNALVVPTTWYAQRFSQASLYFFDPTAGVLVPQPVFLPRGEQLPSALVDALLAGPGDGLGRVLRTFLPAGLRVGVSVPVSTSGVARVELLGDAPPLTDAGSVRLLAQVAWTLRQVPGVAAVRVTLGGRVVRAPGGGEEYAVSQAVAYDPAGRGASLRLYGLQDGRLSLVADGDLSPAGGPFSDADLGLRAIAVDLVGERAAGVSADGTDLLVGPVGKEDQDPAPGDPASATVVVDDARALLRPAWDLLGRLWVVDTAPGGGARVRYVRDGRVRTVAVPGISGREVSAVLVSRDGTRLVATVRGPDADTVQVARIAADEQGRVLGASRATVLDRATTGSQDVLGLAWTSPTTVAFLTSVVPGDLFEVRSLSIDGAPTSTVSRAPGAEGLVSTSVSAPVTGLVGSPDASRTPYAATPTGLVELGTGRQVEFAEPDVTAVGYVG